MDRILKGVANYNSVNIHSANGTMVMGIVAKAHIPSEGVG
jgi:hypothetical protein